MHMLEFIKPALSITFPRQVIIPCRQVDFANRQISKTKKAAEHNWRHATTHTTQPEMDCWGKETFPNMMITSASLIQNVDVQLSSLKQN